MSEADQINTSAAFEGGIDLPGLIECMSEGVAVFDAADRLLMMNRLYLGHFADEIDWARPGISFEEMLRGGVARGFYAGEPAVTEEFFLRRLEAHRAADGRKVVFPAAYGRWFQSRDYRMQGGGTLVVRSDVTELVRRERELQESEERLRSLADNLPGLVFRRVRSPQGEIRHTYLSPRLKDMLGVDPADVIEGRVEIPEQILPDDRQRFVDGLEESARSLTPLSIELRLLRQPDGMLRWWQIHTTPQRRDDGSVFWDGIALDITDRKAGEERLQQALKMEAIGHLTGGIAHDFNNLLAVMLGNVELLAERRKSLDADEAAMLDNILIAGERAAELTRRLLAYARRQSLSPRNIDLNLLLETMTPLLQRALDGGSTLELKLEPGLQKVEADSDKLENAVLSLVLNSRDAMPTGGRIEIATRNENLDQPGADAFGGIQPGSYAVLRVSDNGVGMPPALAARAIEPFFTTKPVGRGSGLGLSMIFGLAKQSGGHLTIDSAVGRGTTVEIYLPAAQPSESPESERTAGAGASQRPEVPVVLLVEDDAAVRDTVKTMLSSLGYKVATAPNGLEALALLERGPPPDLLLTDVVMPGGIDGIELARQARTRHPGISVVLASGYNHGLNSGEQSPEPGIRLIGKPFRVMELAETLRLALDRI